MFHQKPLFEGDDKYNKRTWVRKWTLFLFLRCRGTCPHTGSESSPTLRRDLLMLFFHVKQSFLLLSQHLWIFQSSYTLQVISAPYRRGSINPVVTQCKNVHESFATHTHKIARHPEVVSTVHLTHVIGNNHHVSLGRLWIFFPFFFERRVHLESQALTSTPREVDLNEPKLALLAYNSCSLITVCISWFQKPPSGNYIHIILSYITALRRNLHFPNKAATTHEEGDKITYEIKQEAWNEFPHWVSYHPVHCFKTFTCCNTFVPTPFRILS